MHKIFSLFLVSENSIKNRWNSAAFKKRIFSFNYPKASIEYTAICSTAINVMDIRFDDNITKYIKKANEYLENRKKSAEFIFQNADRSEEQMDLDKNINLISVEKVNIRYVQ